MYEYVGKKEYVGKGMALWSFVGEGGKYCSLMDTLEMITRTPLNKTISCVSVWMYEILVGLDVQHIVR
jgi:hypothetical protein